VTSKSEFRLKVVGLSASDLDVIRSLRRSMSAQIPAIVDSFYLEMTQHSDLREIISQHTTTDRLKKTFTMYIERLFKGEIDPVYDEERIQIGKTHYRVGLPLKWYLGMFSILEHRILNALESTRVAMNPDNWVQTYTAISRLMKYDQLLAVDAYVDAHTTELRRQTEEAERSREAKSLFLAQVSHELRTPLSSILGYTDLILDTAKEISPSTRQHLSVLHRNATNLLSLINGLIEIGQADSGRWKTEETFAQINDLFDDIATNAEGLLAGKPVQFIRDYNKRGKFKAVLDFSKLRQILLNLVSNACKFTDSGYVALDFEKVDQRLVIRVRDSGPGIPDVYRDQIFEEFFRIPSESSKKPGSGLGLTLVKSLASSMGGSVDVSPESPKGTIFTVKLPLKSV